MAKRSSSREVKYSMRKESLRTPYPTYPSASSHLTRRSTVVVQEEEQLPTNGMVVVVVSTSCSAAKDVEGEAEESFVRLEKQLTGFGKTLEARIPSSVLLRRLRPAGPCLFANLHHFITEQTSAKCCSWI